MKRSNICLWLSFLLAIFSLLDGKHEIGDVIVPIVLMFMAPIWAISEEIHEYNNKNH